MIEKGATAEIWLRIEKVCAATGWTERHARRAAATQNWNQRLAESRGRNGKHEREYALSSLPADAQVRFLQARLGEPQSAGAGESIVATRDAILETKGETLPLFAAVPVVPKEERLKLDAADQKEADRRLEIIAPMIDFEARTNGHRPNLPLPGGRQVSNLNHLAQWIASQHGVSERNIWRWFSTWKKEGYLALARKVRKDRGKSRVFEGSPAAAAFI